MNLNWRGSLERPWLLIAIGLAIVGAASAVLLLRKPGAERIASSWPRIVKAGTTCGLIDRAGHFVVNPQFDAINPSFQSGLYPVSRGGRWGVIDATGREIVAPGFEFAAVPHGSMATSDVQLLNEGRIGIADEGGVRIQPAFAAPLVFSAEGVAVAVRARGPGRPRGVGDIESASLIDRTGRVLVTSPNWVAGMPAGAGLFIMLERGPDVRRLRSRLVNQAGQPVVDRSFEQLLPFDEQGLALFRDNSKWGFISTRGEVVIPARFDEVDRGGRASFTPFDDSGMAAAAFGGRWGYIDRSGNWVIQPQFATASKFGSQGLAVVGAGGDSGSGLIDRQGHYVLNPQFARIGTVSLGGLIPVARRQGPQPQDPLVWGFANLAGEVVVEPRFHGFALPHDGSGLVAVDTGQLRFQSFSESYDESGGIERYWSATDAHWGFIDARGNMVMSPTYQNAEGFDETGLAAVQSNSLWGFIDRTGRLVIRPQFQAVECIGREPH